MGLACCIGCQTVPLAPGSIVDCSRRETILPAQLAARVNSADIVLVGEVHPHPGHHGIQRKILEIMASQNPHLVVGVEWLDYTAQEACRLLSAKRITVDEFAERVDWKKKWGYPLKLYRPILQKVRDQVLNLIALNAPAHVVKKVAKTGLKSLTSTERAMLAPSLDLKDAAYAQELARQFKVHGIKGAAQQKNFLAAQIARDETMAHNLALALEPWPDSGKKAVVFAGAGHMANHSGLPPRIKRRLPGALVLTVLPVSARDADELQEHPPGQVPADLLVVSQPAPPRPPRLGLFLRPTAGGLRVVAVSPQSPAGKAGIRKGDLLMAVDGRELNEVMDIHRALKNAPFKPHEYRLKRGPRELVIVITLARSEK